MMCIINWSFQRLDFLSPSAKLQQRSVLFPKANYLFSHHLPLFAASLTFRSSFWMEAKISGGIIVWSGVCLFVPPP